MNSLQDIQRAITGLKPRELAELYTWLDRQRSVGMGRPEPTVFEQGLGLFGSPEDAAILDEVVQLAYEERRRPGSPSMPDRIVAATAVRFGVPVISRDGKIRASSVQTIW